ncbi:MAG: M56 family metallopeptidase [Acidobacteriota bacterium]|nr:M56 family metallopeptidase [Acidobacteriota bacterium]
MNSLLAGLTIKVSAILLLALIASLCLRRSSASARHWVLAVGVVSALAMPALGVLAVDGLGLRLGFPFAGPADGAWFGASAVSGSSGSRLDGLWSALAALASADVVGWLAVTIWLAGAVACTGVLLAGLARLRWLRRSSNRLRDGRWHRLCTDLARSCGLKRGVHLLLGQQSGLVATWGWWRPVVLLPASACGWPAERMRIVLLHELAHVRRGDWMLLMAAEALRCIWWFNPLAWAVRGHLRRESEHAADDLVLAQGVAPTTCATHLVELAREVRENRRTWLPAPAMARSSYLNQRLSVMLNSDTSRRPMTRVARFGSLSVLVAAAIFLASLQVEPVSAAGSAELGTTLGESDRGGDLSMDSMRDGDGFSVPTRIHGVPPVYPPEAQAAGIEGIVVLKATIGRTGEVIDVEVQRSVPLLDEAAIAAVSEWRYAPLLVDGDPIRVQMTVSVDFTLTGR